MWFRGPDFTPSLTIGKESNVSSVRFGKNRLGLIALCCLGAAVAMSTAAWAESKSSGYKPTSEFEKRDIEGWTVHVEKTLVEEHPEIGPKALRILKNQLYRISRAVPGEVLKKIRKVPIWIQYRCKDRKCAEYHPTARWLREHGQNPEKAKCVDIANAENFVEWTRTLRWMMLHEMAHAYHDRVLGFDHPGVKAAYERAKKSGKYDEVLHWTECHARHWGLTNHKEFFAEMTETYFGTNEYFPFVRAELKGHDRKIYDLLAEVWDAKSDEGD